MANNETAWDRHARRYFAENDLPLDTVDYCGRDFPTDSDLNIIGDPTGLRVLELGSGACNCGIALARNGASFSLNSRDCRTEEQSYTGDSQVRFTMGASTMLFYLAVSGAIVFKAKRESRRSLVVYRGTVSANSA